MTLTMQDIAFRKFDQARVDPALQEKREYCSWLSSSIPPPAWRAFW